MITMYKRSINVNRHELISTLQKNLDIHKSEYQQALLDFKAGLLVDLKAALKYVNKSEPDQLNKLTVNINFPENHEKDFQEVIEMLSHSVDETITLDADAFQAYYKNKWPWSRIFIESNAKYKIAGSFLK